jgi:hypothetical protein
MTDASMQVAEYSPTEAGLAELASRLGNIVHDVKTTDGMSAARKDRRECVTLRTALEDKRVELKAGILERGRLVDGEAKRIRLAIEALETPIDEQIRVEEKRRQDERDERDRAERNRVAEIRGRIDRIVRRPVDAIGLSVAGLNTLISAMESSPPDRVTFAEFFDEAARAFGASLDQLVQARKRKADDEAAAAQLQQERADFERQREAEAERQRHAKAEQDRVEAAAKAERDAADKAAAEARAKADADAAEARRQADEMSRLAREAEVKRLEAQRQEQERAADEQRRQEAERKAEAERVEAEQRAEVRRAIAHRAEAIRVKHPMTIPHVIDRAQSYRTATEDEAPTHLLALLEIFAMAMTSSVTIKAPTEFAA